MLTVVVDPDLIPTVAHYVKAVTMYMTVSLEFTRAHIVCFRRFTAPLFASKVEDDPFSFWAVQVASIDIGGRALWDIGCTQMTFGAGFVHKYLAITSALAEGVFGEITFKRWDINISPTAAQLETPETRASFRMVFRAIPGVGVEI